MWGRVRGRGKVLHSCVYGCLWGERPWFQSDVVVSEWMMLIVFLGVDIQLPWSYPHWDPPFVSCSVSSRIFIIFHTKAWTPLGSSVTSCECPMDLEWIAHYITLSADMGCSPKPPVVSVLQTTPGHPSLSSHKLLTSRSAIMYAPTFRVFPGTLTRLFSDTSAVLRGTRAFCS